jgi:uncharacterized membrane protein
MRNDAGQAFVFVAFAMMVLVGMAALVVDGGSWYQAQRKLQTAADAGALAGAQHLPTDQTQAKTVAVDYAQKNYAGIPAPTIVFPNAGTIDVSTTAKAPGIFARIYGSAFNEVTVSAAAQARVFAPAELKNVAPIAVKNTAACIVSNPSCFGQTVTVSFDESNIASSLIGLINVECNSDSSGGCGSGRTGGDDLRNLIQCNPCNPNALPTNKWYGVKTGGTEGPVEQGLGYAAAAGMTLLFPVFDKSCPGDSSCGSKDKSFHVIGWAAFVIHDGGVQWDTHTKSLTGHFVTFVATDLAAGNPINDPNNDFGVHVIVLTK